MQWLGVRLRFRLELVGPHRASSILQPKSFAKFARYSHFCRLPQISRNCERNLTPPKYRKTFCAILVWANAGVQIGRKPITELRKLCEPMNRKARNAT